MPTWLLMVIAGLAAAVMPVQAIVNGRLGTSLGQPLLAALASFATGTVVLAVLYICLYGRIPWLTPNAEIPWYLYTGGLLGCVYVFTVLMLVPQIGPANVLAAGIVGQLLVALLLDHWGILGVPLNPITSVRLLGAVLLIAGTWLIQMR